MESGGGGHGATGSAYTGGRGSCSASPDADCNGSGSASLFLAFPHWLLLLRRVRALTDDGLDDQVREKPTGLPKSRASVMGIKLKKSNEHMDSTTLNQIEEEIKKSLYHRLTEELKNGGGGDRSSVGPAGRAVLVCPILRDTVAIRVVVPLIRLHGRRRVRLGLRWL
jgi:hypothetical protein